MSPDMIVLIAEDDDGHAALIEKHLRRGGLVKPCRRLRDGQETLEFFFGPQTQESLAGWHQLVLVLDINLPRVNGIEVLRRMKEHEMFKKVPVFMLSTTDNPREIETCYAMGCNLYLTKPTDSEAFALVISRLGSFLDVVTVPSVHLESCQNTPCH